LTIPQASFKIVCSVVIALAGDAHKPRQRATGKNSKTALLTVLLIVLLIVLLKEIFFITQKLLFVKSLRRKLKGKEKRPKEIGYMLSFL
jgi:hypothetical protein